MPTECVSPCSLPRRKLPLKVLHTSWLDECYMSNFYPTYEVDFVILCLSVRNIIGLILADLFRLIRAKNLNEACLLQFFLAQNKDLA